MTALVQQRRSKNARETGTRDQLLRGARDCLRSRGLAGTSSRALAEAAGVNLAAITYYFGSKERLVADALVEELRDWLDAPLRILAGPGDPASRMLETVRTLNAAFDQARGRASALIEVFVHAARQPGSRGPVTALWQELRGHLATTVAELKSRDAVPGWVEPEALAALVLAVGGGTVLTAAVDPDGVNHHDIAVQFANLLLATEDQRRR